MSTQCYGMNNDGARCTLERISKYAFCEQHQDGKVYTPLIVDFLNKSKEFTSLYSLGKPLGVQGGVGQLFNVTHNKTQKPAILKAKVQQRNTKYSVDNLRHECKILSFFSTQHYHVVQMIDYFDLVFIEDTDSFLIGYTMEPLLYDLYSLRNIPFNIKDVCRQLIGMMSQFHESGYIHCDLSPANICIRQTKPLELVLIDFGFSFEENMDFKGFGGNVHCYSLQQETRNILSYRDDMESIGYVIWHIVEGTLPWGHIPDDFGNKERIEMKRTLSKAPRRIVKYIQACRKTPLHQKPNYSHLLSILGIRKHDIKSDYITPQSKFIDYSKVELTEFNGIKGNKKNIDILNDNDLQTRRDLSLFMSKHDMFGKDGNKKLQDSLVKMGIPESDAKAFVRFYNLY